MTAIFLAFLSGIITVLAPCVFPLLPVILGVSGSDKKYNKAILVISSLVISIFLFTISIHFLIVNNTSQGIFIRDILRYFSGGFIFFYGVITLFPQIWTAFSTKLKLSQKSDSWLDKASANSTNLGSILVGLSLGPVFSSCSPTYFVILGLLSSESNQTRALLLLAMYLLGLTFILILISFFGYSIIKKLKWAVNPNGVFKKIFGVILIVIGIMIFFSLDKSFEAWLLNFDWYSNIFQFENGLTEGGKKLVE